MFDSKNKFKFLLHLTDQTIDGCTIQVEKFTEFTQNIDEKKATIPLMVRLENVGLTYLSKKVVEDTFFTAFINIMRNAIDGEKKFFNLGNASVSLYEIQKSIFQIGEDAFDNLHERKKNYISLYNNLRKAIHNEGMRGMPETTQYLIPIINFFQSTAPVNDEEILTEDMILIIHQRIVQQSIAYFTQNPPPIALVDISSLIGDLRYSYNDMVVQCDSVKKEMGTHMENYTKSLNNLKAFKSYMGEEQVRNLYWPILN